MWKNQGWAVPIVEESYNPDRTRLTLEFVEKRAIKTSDKNKRKKVEENRELIREYLCENGLSKTNDIAEAIGLSAARTRVILNEMPGVVMEGANKNRRYRLSEE